MRDFFQRFVFIKRTSYTNFNLRKKKKKKMKKREREKKEEEIKYREKKKTNRREKIQIASYRTSISTYGSTLFPFQHNAINHGYSRIYIHR